MREAIVVSVLVLPFALGLAVAGPCDSDGQPALGRIEIGPVAGHVFYVDDRNSLFGNGLWIYEETNGVYVGGDVTKDLQRGSMSDIIPSTNCACDPDPCVDRPYEMNPDQDHF